MPLASFKISLRMLLNQIGSWYCAPIPTRKCKLCALSFHQSYRFRVRFFERRRRLLLQIVSCVWSFRTCSQYMFRDKIQQKYVFNKTSGVLKFVFFMVREFVKKCVTTYTYHFYCNFFSPFILGGKNCKTLSQTICCAVITTPNNDRPQLIVVALRNSVNFLGTLHLQCKPKNTSTLSYILLHCMRHCTRMQ